MNLIVYLFLFFIHTRNAVYKTSIPNDNIQTGQVTAYANSLDSTPSYFTISYATSFSTSTMEAGIGIVGCSFNMEGSQFGWDLIVSSYDQTQMII